MEPVKKEFLREMPTTLQPAIRYHPKLSGPAKILFGDILMCAENGVCSNGASFFAELYAVDPQTVYNWMAQLQAVGLIKRDRYEQNKIYILNDGTNLD